MADAPTYETMGVEYSGIRRADPRIEAAIHAALGDARRVLNIGAGTGSYEPTDREMIAVEPSAVMRAQRPPHLVEAIEGVAEDIPLPDKSVDATMGVFTMHHWDDVDRGLAEVARVTRDRVAFLTLDVDRTATIWLAEYLPEMIELNSRDFPTFDQLADAFPGLEIDPVPAPADCTDGFCIALWSRPEAQLDPRVRQSSSIWHQIPDEVIERRLSRLRADLESGEWDRRFGHLRDAETLDIGLRLVRAEL
jgi:SAM-dependent methyltransferase